MDVAWLILLTVLSLANAGLLIALLFRKRDPGADAPLLRLEQALPEQLRAQREESSRAASELRQEIASSLGTGFERLDRIRDTLDKKLSELQARNEQKLEEMRRTVDEKLQSTLERRSGEPFKHVSERLEQGHKSLADMQAHAR